MTAASVTPKPHPGFADGHLTGAPVDIVWNTTLVCPWDCAVCCVDAVHVAKRGDQILMRSRGLEVADAIPNRPERGTIFDQAAAKRQIDGHELTLTEKLLVLEHLSGFEPKLDISGGDPLSVSENFDLLKAASERFGRERITLTATGAGLSRIPVEKVGPLIVELNFTYDGPRANPTPLRPSGYTVGNLGAAKSYAAFGVATRAECPLSADNIDDAILEQIYMDLHDAGVDLLLIMRLFPAGRGRRVAVATPTASEYRRAIATLRRLEARYGRPRLKLQCALRMLDAPNGTANPCDLVRESFGLLPDGTLLASPWAIGPRGEPLEDIWVLGNLAKDHLSKILESPRARRFYRRLDDNWGHCKIFAYLHGAHPTPLERVFEPADPLYTQMKMEGAA